MKRYSIYNDRRREQAEAHDRKMRAAHKAEIKNSVENSKVYRNAKFNSDKRVTGAVPKIVMFKGTSDEAARQFGGCLLNFASYKHPGGGFISGAMAQEEAVCHASDLYEVIGDQKFQKEYEYNLANMHGSLYEDWAIWSPGIIFEDAGGSCEADVITCPAPNLGAHVKSFGKTPENYYGGVYGKRVQFILDVARDNNVETLVAGAFGCGVFRNDPVAAAKEWLKRVKMFGSGLKKVVFAIPDDKNFEAFRSVIEENGGKTGDGVLYGGIFLGGEARGALKSLAAGMGIDGWKTYCTHMTIYFHHSKNEEAKRWVRNNIGKKVWLKITAVGSSEKAAAAKVECDGVPCDNKVKHVTIACNAEAGGKPFDSNAIQEWSELETPLCVIGTVGVYDKINGIVTSKTR